MSRTADYWKKKGIKVDDKLLHTAANARAKAQAKEAERKEQQKKQQEKQEALAEKTGGRLAAELGVPRQQKAAAKLPDAPKKPVAKLPAAPRSARDTRDASVREAYARRGTTQRGGLPGDLERAIHTSAVHKEAARQNATRQAPSLPKWQADYEALAAKNPSSRLAYEMGVSPSAYEQRVRDPQYGAALLGSIGTGIPGSILSTGETQVQGFRNFMSDLNNADLEKKRMEYLALAEQFRKAKSKEAQRTILAQMEQKRKEGDALMDQTAVDQNKIGQRLTAKSRALHAKATEGLQGFDRFLVDSAASIGTNLPAIGLGVLNPVAGLGLMGMQAAGAKSSILNERGIDARESARRGLGAGIIEVGTERIPLANLSKILKTGLGQSAFKGILRQSGLEGGEEAVAYTLNFLADKAAADPEARFSLQELGNAVAMGAVSGVAFGTGGSAIHALRRPVHATTTPQGPETATSGPRPIPPPPNKAMPQAAIKQEDAPASYGDNGISPPPALQNASSSIPTILRANEDIKQLLSHGRRLPEAMADDIFMDQRIPRGQDAVKNPAAPDTGEWGASPQAEQAQSAYMRQIDAVMRGEATPYLPLVVGDTPEILTKYGAAQRRLVLNQSDIRKIAYPQGYMGGKHNLGFYALKQLPKQLEQPVAILKSSTQPNSLVVFTEFLDAGNRPVMVPIHLGKSGQLGISNEIASMYGRSSFDQFIEAQRKAGNVIYEDKNRSLHTLPSVGLQLPEVVSDADPIFNSTLPQDGSGVKKQFAPQAGKDTPVEQGPGEFGAGTVGAAQHNPSSYSALQNEYGTIPPGETPARVVDVPKQTEAGTQTRRFVRTAMEAEAIPENMLEGLEREIADGRFAYLPITDKAATDYAQKTIEYNGFAGALAQWESVAVGKTVASKNDIVLGETLLNQAAQTGDVNLAMKLIVELAAEGTRAGQNTQAMRLLKKMTPSGQLYYLQQSTQKLNQDLLDRFKAKAPHIAIDEELAGALLGAQNQAEIDAAVEKIKQHIADQVPATWMDKWNAWRYLSMLGNLRTHIKNIVGNAVFIPAVMIKNRLAQGMEVVSRLPRADRTKSVSFDRKRRAFAKHDFLQHKESITSGGKYSPVDGILEKRTIFRTNMIEGPRKGNLAALEAEDAFFLRLHYVGSFASAMKARKLSLDFLKSGTKEANLALEGLRNYATLEAQKATYRDASAVASFLSSTKRQLGNSDKLSLQALGVGMEGVLPFVRTPINILRRGVEYSPVGLLNGIKSAAFDSRSGKVSASEAIDKIAAGLTGTGIFALGAFLRSLGLISGAGEDDEKRAGFERLQGKQNYALTIGDTSYTLDWMAPVSLPLFVGVESYDLFQNDHPERGLSDFLDSLTKITEPMVETSMLQGLNNTFQAVAFGDSPLSDVGIELLSGYASQGIPTLFGQIARTVDPVRRSSYIDKNSGVPVFAQKFWQKQQAKIPLASKGLMPYVDQWGRTQENGSLRGRLLQNFVSPAYVSKNKSAAPDKELQRLYQATGDKAVLPGYAPKTITVSGKKIDFTREQYLRFAETRGTEALDALSQLVDSTFYQDLSELEKAEMVTKIHSYATATAKASVSDYTPEGTDKKIQEAKELGLSVVDFLEMYQQHAAIKDKYGEKGPGGKQSATAFLKWLDGKGLSAPQRDFAEDNFRYWSSFSAKPEGYRMEYMSESAQEKWPKVESRGFSEEEYVKYYPYIADGDKKKAERIEDLISAGLSASRAYALWDAVKKK